MIAEPLLVFTVDGVAMVNNSSRTVEDVMRELSKHAALAPEKRLVKVSKELGLGLDSIEAAIAFARDAWCTPAHVAAVLPPRHRLIDPCSNPRSLVDAEVRYMLENDQNGLELTWCPMVPPMFVYVNAGFSDLFPWAEKLRAERERIAGAAFMCNVDNSTSWWKELTELCSNVFFFDRRLRFVPYPGVPQSTNNKPQALIGDAAFFEACKPELFELGEMYERTRRRVRSAA